MKSIKKRLAVMLCMLLTIPTMLGILPQAKLEAQAATTYGLFWSGVSYSYDSIPEIQITQNTTDFYVGDYLYAYSQNGYIGYLSMLSGASYKSSDSSVVIVNSKTGLIKAKKAGSATITVKYKGVTEKCKIKVVSSVGSQIKEYQALKKRAQQLVKAYGNGITKKNRYQIVNTYRLYDEEEVFAPYTANTSSWSGMEVKSTWKDGKTIYRNRARMPILAHANAVADTVDNYIQSKNPVGTGASKLFQSTSISGKGTTVAVKLKSKVTEDQIFGIQAAATGLWDTSAKSSSKANFPVYIQDTNTGHKYYAIATATKGSNMLSIKMSTLTLKKGRTYRIVGYARGDFASDWTKQGKVSFKAK